VLPTQPDSEGPPPVEAPGSDGFTISYPFPATVLANPTP
jgi:hypothetical protein